jgi:formylglycine-generating enzyme required for sulfatase activity
MYYVTWEGAALYCNYLSEKEGLRPAYQPDNKWACDFSIGGYHLPTEAQWECAARGGQAKQLYPWGNIISAANANFGNTLTRLLQSGRCLTMNLAGTLGFSYT